MKRHLRLDLDRMWEEGYYYTTYDVCGYGHAIVIDAEDKEAFLDEFAHIWRERAAKLLEEYEVEVVEE